MPYVFLSFKDYWHSKAISWRLYLHAVCNTDQKTFPQYLHIVLVIALKSGNKLLYFLAASNFYQFYFHSLFLSCKFCARFLHSPVWKLANNFIEVHSKDK